MYPDADLPTPATSRNVCRPILFVDEYQVLTYVPEASVLKRSKSITGAADTSSKKEASIFQNKMDMTIEETRKLIRDLENLPPEKLGAVGQIIKTRGKIFKQNNEELELDIDSVDVETLWELDRFVTNYNKSKAEVVVQARARVVQNAPITTLRVSGVIEADNS
ncbi:hypothetical protein R3W88_022722 [Solanum pinnatisectum]|uniref:NET domain-containing protein n=1 Tax=Solanum pinnatisectum TaxID=50273 RepID=A0AAV9LXL9_9SOLN|nr:hypothetical protein R3W88_022722 [Solanum pinnatisectum]